jgi:hypothetical protein
MRCGLDLCHGPRDRSGRGRNEASEDQEHAPYPLVSRSSLSRDDAIDGRIALSEPSSTGHRR